MVNYLFSILEFNSNGIVMMTSPQNKNAPALIMDMTVKKIDAFPWIRDVCFDGLS